MYEVTYCTGTGIGCVEGFLTCDIIPSAVVGPTLAWPSVNNKVDETTLESLFLLPLFLKEMSDYW